MTTRTVACIALLSLGVLTGQAFAYSYAGAMAGLTTPTGLRIHQDPDADHVTPGSFGTTIILGGLFPLLGAFSFSPSFSFLSTNGQVNGDPGPPHDYDVRFQQSELAVDLLWKPRGLRKLRVGPGISAAWWSAIEDRDTRPLEFRSEEFSRQVIRGQSALLRGVVHLMLRNPEVSGATVKLVAALPMTELLKIEDSAATGYVAVHVGFSMVLN